MYTNIINPLRQNETMTFKVNGKGQGQLSGSYSKLDIITVGYRLIMHHMLDVMIVLNCPNLM